jgi:hypothetical protein
MRSPTMVRKKERMPDYYPVFEDLATPLGLAGKLDPNAKVIRLVGKTKSVKKIKDQSFEKQLTDGYAHLRSSRYGGSEVEYVLDCLDKKGHHIEQEYKAGDLADEVLSSEIPEMVIKHVDYLLPATKSCDICSINGIDSILISNENADPGPIEPINGSPITHAQYFLDLMAENHRSGVYPESNIRRYMKAVLHTVALRGYDGKNLVSSSEFLPIPYGQQAVESIITPWARERWWTTIRKPAIRCTPHWQSTLNNDFRGRAVA